MPPSFASTVATTTATAAIPASRHMTRRSSRCVSHQSTESAEPSNSTTAPLLHPHALSARVRRGSSRLRVSASATASNCASCGGIALWAVEPPPGRFGALLDRSRRRSCSGVWSTAQSAATTACDSRCANQATVFRWPGVAPCADQLELRLSVRRLGARCRRCARSLTPRVCAEAPSCRHFTRRERRDSNPRPPALTGQRFAAKSVRFAKRR